VNGESIDVGGGTSGSTDMPCPGRPSTIRLLRRCTASSNPRASLPPPAPPAMAPGWPRRPRNTSCAGMNLCARSAPPLEHERVPRADGVGAGQRLRAERSALARDTMWKQEPSRHASRSQIRCKNGSKPFVRGIVEGLRARGLLGVEETHDASALTGRCAGSDAWRGAGDHPRWSSFDAAWREGGVLVTSGGMCRRGTPTLVAVDGQ